MPTTRETETTEVIFRKFKDEGDIIAILPQYPGTNDVYTCESYQHMGQHGSCDPYGLIGVTTLAKPIEYKPLLHELKAIGYKVKIIKRNRQKHLDSRRSELKRISTG